MATYIGERVDVVAVFVPTLKPVKFRWKERVFRVEKITHTWRTKEGSAGKFHFSVTDGTALYELSYNQQEMLWRLEKVEA